METLPQNNFEQPQSPKTIEQQANFEGSWTNLMCERLRNPEIQRQVIDLLYEAVQNSLGDIIDVDGVEKDENGNEKKDKKGQLIFIFKHALPQTREQIEKKFCDVLKNIQNSTPISFGFTQPNSGGEVDEKDSLDENGEYLYDKKREVLNLCWMSPLSGKKPNEKQWQIIESHEKGHVVRKYSRKTTGGYLGADGKYCLGVKFWRAFDFSVVDYSDEYCENFRNELKKERIDISDITNERIKRQSLRYLRDPSELAERMSQLKNYFGMSSNKIFTKEHLSYAKEHYCKDIDFDNVMTQFFQSITPEKEDAFIELINSAGI
jgi:hypothetical protein